MDERERASVRSLIKRNKNGDFEILMGQENLASSKFQGYNSAILIYNVDKSPSRLFSLSGQKSVSPSR